MLESAAFVVGADGRLALNCSADFMRDEADLASNKRTIPIWLKKKK